MNSIFNRLNLWFDGLLHFSARVVSGFRANQGFLLAGAVAYNTLLSIVPMLVLILVALSQVIEPELVLNTSRQYMALVAPGQADALTEQVAAVIANWKLVGVVGLLVLLFFSSMAFTVLENAMSVIFAHRVAIRNRHFLVSAIIPYCYILLLAVALLLVSLANAELHTMDEQSFSILGREWTLSGYTPYLVYFLGFTGEVLLLTSLYLVMPVGRLAFHHALAGGVTATMLWELTRHFLVWYFSTLSLANLIYGTFATTIIILISLEIAAIILLFGAQVIAEYERMSSNNDA